jgi:hypothetical protein
MRDLSGHHNIGARRCRDHRWWFDCVVLAYLDSAACSSAQTRSSSIFCGFPDPRAGAGTGGHPDCRAFRLRIPRKSV